MSNMPGCLRVSNRSKHIRRLEATFAHQSDSVRLSGRLRPHFHIRVTASDYQVAGGHICTSEWQRQIIRQAEATFAHQSDSVRLSGRLRPHLHIRVTASDYQAGWGHICTSEWQRQIIRQAEATFAHQSDSVRLSGGWWPHFHIRVTAATSFTSVSLSRPVSMLLALNSLCPHVLMYHRLYVSISLQTCKYATGFKQSLSTCVNVPPALRRYLSPDL